MKDHKKVLLLGLLLGASLLLCAYGRSEGEAAPEQEDVPQETTQHLAVPVQPEEPEEPKHEIREIDGLTYVDGILIANKTYSLPEDYDPGVDETAQAALDRLIQGAAKEGLNLYVISDYRSYRHQTNTYARFCNKDGKAEADRYSARPGHSEHQTGLAFDLNSTKQSFGETAEGKWIAAHCWEYGFILRYPQDKEAITGYMYEPWHLRYLGEELAQDVTESGLCLEEYLDITSVYAEE